MANNETILADFLRAHLPHRYSVSTGKVSAAGGRSSGQIDVIIHDRLDTPTLSDGRAWSFVPIEATFAVIAVKTTLNRAELLDAMNSIKSVRELPRTAAISYAEDVRYAVDEDDVLRPRGLVFGFRSEWASAHSADDVFRSLLADFDDRYRPNGMCIVDQCFAVRTPYKVETNLIDKHALMHFFLFLTRSHSLAT